MREDIRDYIWNMTFPIGSLWVDTNYYYFIMILEEQTDKKFIVKALRENGKIVLISKYALEAHYRRIEVLLHDS